MFADGHLLLIRMGARSPEDQRVVLFSGVNPMGIGWPVSRSLNLHADEYESVIDHWENVEYEAVSAASYFEVLDRLPPVHRAVRNLHAVLQDARKQVNGDRNLISATALMTLSVVRNCSTRGRKTALILQLLNVPKNNLRRRIEWRNGPSICSLHSFSVGNAFGSVRRESEIRLEENPPWAFVLVGVGLLMGLVLAAFVTPRRFCS